MFSWRAFFEDVSLGLWFLIERFRVPITLVALGVLAMFLFLQQTP